MSSDAIIPSLGTTSRVDLAAVDARQKGRQLLTRCATIAQRASSPRSSWECSPFARGVPTPLPSHVASHLVADRVDLAARRVRAADPFAEVVDPALLLVGRLGDQLVRAPRLGAGRRAGGRACVGGSRPPPPPRVY